MTDLLEKVIVCHVFAIYPHLVAIFVVNNGRKLETWRQVGQDGRVGK
jgi:hypothetical protein